MTKEIVWTPPEEIIKNSKLTSFIKHCNLKDYDTLESKALQNPGWLWDNVIKFRYKLEDQQIYIVNTLPYLKEEVEKGNNMAFYLDTHFTPEGNLSILKSFINQVDKKSIDTILFD